MSFVGKNIRYLRKQMGISQEALAEKVGLNRGNISSYEKGLAEPRLEKLAEVSRFFHIPVLFMIERDLEMEGVLSVTDLLKSGSDPSDLEILVRKLDNKTDELEKILNGFQEYHKMKMAKLKEMNPDLNKMAVDFEELLEVSSVLLEQHQTLLHYLLQSFPHTA
jgi:transcriptional regulator with XRE-family HTH domain